MGATRSCGFLAKRIAAKAVPLRSKQHIRSVPAPCRTGERLKLSKKLLIGCALVAAVLVPLAALGQSWFLERPRARYKAFLTGLGLGDCVKAGNITEADVDKVAANLNLTPEETEKLKTLIEEVKPLKEDLKEKMEEIRAIIGPKIQEKVEATREQCKGILNQTREIVAEIRTLCSELRKAETEGNAEQAEQLKSQIEEKKQELGELCTQLRESNCGPMVAGRLKGRMMVRWGMGRRCIGPIVVGPIGDWWQDLSEEDRSTLKSLREDVRDLGQEIRSLMGKGTQEEFNAIAGKLADMLYRISEFMKEKGITLPEGVGCP